jgi:hypothetical protein
MSKETRYISTSETYKTATRSRTAIEKSNQLVDKLERQTSTSYTSHVLQHNQVSFPRATKKTLKGAEPFLKFGKFKNFKQNLYFDRDNTTLKKNIRYVRMFYQYLRLVLECEQKELKLKPSDKPFKLDRRKFRDFDLEQVMSYKHHQFDDFLKEYKHLFVVEPIKLIQSADEFDPDNLTVSIPKKSSLASVKREIEKLIANKLIGESTKFVFSDRITPYTTLHYEYNSLVLAFNENTRNVIMNVCNQKYKNVPDFMKKKANSDEYETESVIYSYESAVSRTLAFGRERMYRVCDGVFP